MKLKIVNSKRTNNFKDAECQNKIMSLWQENSDFIEEAMKQSMVVACIYHDYESDYTGDYSVSLGIQSDNSTDFDTALYQWKTYPVNTQDELGVVKTWNQIWDDEKNQLIDRVYDFDYEEYLPDGQVRIKVAVNK